MQTELEVSEIVIAGKAYYRLCLPKKLSDALRITRGTKLRIDILEVINATQSNLKQQPLGLVD